MKLLATERQVLKYVTQSPGITAFELATFINKSPNNALFCLNRIGEIYEIYLSQGPCFIRGNGIKSNKFF